MEELDDSYKEIVEMNETGGWANIYYGVFSSVINENNFKKCAEVGIGYGLHANEILENTKVEKLYLIDPMKYYPDDSFVDDVEKMGGFEKLCKNIKTNLKKHESRYTWFRQESVSITTEQIPDGSLDVVFIDGDHSYHGVTNDLNFWWKKIKIGGYILGDDYASGIISTTNAVDDFTKKNNLKIEFLYKQNSSYPIYKFIKLNEI